MNLSTEHDLTNALESYVKEIVEQMIDDKLDTELTADNVKGLDDFVETQIDKYLTDNPPDLEIDQISGLENAIEKEIDRQLEDLEVDASNIRRLNDEISEVLNDWDFTQDSKLMDAVQSEAENYIGDHIEDAVSQALTVVPITVSTGDISDLEVYTNTLIKQAIKDYQQQFLQRLSPVYWFHHLGSWLKSMFITIIK